MYSLKSYWIFLCSFKDVDINKSIRKFRYFFCNVYPWFNFSWPYSILYAIDFYKKINKRRNILDNKCARTRRNNLLPKLS